MIVRNLRVPAIGMLLVAAACSSGPEQLGDGGQSADAVVVDSTPHEIESNAPNAIRDTVSAVQPILNQLRVSSFEPQVASSPAELAALTDLVLTGTMIGATDGRSTGPIESDEPVFFTTAVTVEVENVQSATSNNAVSPGDVISVEFTRISNQDSAELGAELEQSNVEVMLFLENRTSVNSGNQVFGSSETEGQEVYAAWPLGAFAVLEDGVLVPLLLEENDLYEELPGWRGLDSVDRLAGAVVDSAESIAGMRESGVASDESEISAEGYADLLQKWVDEQAELAGLSTEDWLERNGIDYEAAKTRILAAVEDGKSAAEVQDIVSDLIGGS